VKSEIRIVCGANTGIAITYNTYPLAYGAPKTQSQGDVGAKVLLATGMI